MTALLRTPLYDRHVALGARMVEFAGFSMPVQYGSIVAEHKAVREAAGLFDVSHMGQIYLSGPAAVKSVERLLSRPVAKMAVGRVRYGLLCNEAGGVVDDVTVYRIADEELFLCVNASNIEKDYRWVVQHASDGAGVRNRSDETGLLALQGPASPDILAAVASQEVGELRRYQFVRTPVAGRSALVSRTGYTGSDGFEIYAAAEDTGAIFDSLLEAGRTHGLIPAGLGARDTLRLEAAMPLYGHELDDETLPLEAGLDRFVALDRGGFIGAEALQRAQQRGLTRRLVGFVMQARGIARAEYPVCHDGKEVGRVTSGAPSPTLGQSIGLAYVPTEIATVGSRFEVMIRGKATPARVVDTPFVKASG